MNASKVIEHATRAGLQLGIKGKNIIVRNTDHLTDELRREIKQHKPQIIQLLSARNDKLRLSDDDMADLLQDACSGIEIDAQQFWAFLDESDIADIRAGCISLEQLRAFAKSWARYPELVPIGNTRPFPGFKNAGPVCCADCSQFSHDIIGDGTGIGKCAINVPVSFPRYPKAERYCQKFKLKQHQEDNQ